MEQRPSIKTALPKHRYDISDYSATVLGDIDTDDPHPYRWIMALVPMGSQEPSLYICAQRAAPERASMGDYDLRVVSEALTDVVDTADRWGDLEIFTEQALDLACQVLGLKQEMVIKLM
ncbi:hypothetical protein CKO31_17565 [Thiohalocapsa halophila]|uniref:Uncharacterized protein n=1 Tax=Thiohalocapsa halophila TaxID=69359 RepID=A0ABS1CL02_9GAMM|nr:hypothetical protein [Thiohalocapsa halophila]MBK1632517.1 hypothetical protein [Thiohalocapsa halophila]